MVQAAASPYFIPQTCLVKPTRDGEGDLPDIIVLDQDALKNDPYWQKYSSISKGSSVKLVVEVVSTHWQDDYLTKLAEYEKLGVSEYWMADYRALGGVRYIGSSKIPTVWIYSLADTEFEAGVAFQSEAKLSSKTFPKLTLTVEHIVKAGEGKL